MADRQGATTVASALLLLVSTTCLANDAYLGTQGGSIYPRKSTSIRMIEESVSITLSPAGGDVYCKFWLLNTGDGDTVLVGFPDQIRDPFGTKPTRNFRTWVDGSAVAVSLGDSVTDTLGNGSTASRRWHYWRTCFPKDDTVVIENRYEGEWGGNNACQKQFVYIIGSGNTWAGPIGRGRVVFHHGGLFSTLFTYRDSLEQRLRLVPTCYADSAVFEFSDYTPEADEVVSVSVSSYWDFGVNCGYPRAPAGGIAARQETVNELFARYGHMFTKRAIREYYMKKPWYRPKKKLTLADLPEGIQWYIARLTEQQ